MLAPVNGFIPMLGLWDGWPEKKSPMYFVCRKMRMNFKLDHSKGKLVENTCKQSNLAPAPEKCHFRVYKQDPKLVAVLLIVR